MTMKLENYLLKFLLTPYQCLKNMACKIMLRVMVPTLMFQE